MTVKIEFDVQLPDGIDFTDDELEEFLRFQFGDNGCLSGNNPFNKMGLRVKPVFGTFDWNY